MIITLDGESSSGKGTLSNHLSQELEFFNLNTGLIYRLCALMCLENNIPIEKEEKVVVAIKKMKNKDLLLPEDSLLDIKVSSAASIIAAYEDVRALLLPIQRSLSQKALKKYPGVVAEGRDMGTVVFPFAFLKIFLTADLKVRAKRRYEQCQGNYKMSAFSN